METTSVRLRESTLQEVNREYEDYGFDSRGELFRHLIEHREEVLDGAPSEANLADRVDALEEELRIVKRAVAGAEPEAEASPDIEEASQDAPAPPVESVEDLDLPGRGAVLEARQDALRAVYDRLKEIGEAKKGELLEAVDPDAVGYQDRSSFWSNVIGGRDTLSRLPGVEPPVAGGRTWRYEGTES